MLADIKHAAHALQGAICLMVAAERHWHYPGPSLLLKVYSCLHHFPQPALKICSLPADGTTVQQLAQEQSSLLRMVLLAGGRGNASRCAAECIRALVITMDVEAGASGEVDGQLQRSCRKAAWKLLHDPIAGTLGELTGTDERDAIAAMVAGAGCDCHALFGA